MKLEDISGLFLEDTPAEGTARYMRIIKDIYFKPLTKKYVRVVEPVFKNSTDEEDWRLEEMSRCMYGHDGLVGKHYYYFNYFFLKKRTGGKIPVKMRRIDAELFEILESHYRGEKRGRGLVEVKPRGIGASSIAGCDSLQEVSFHPFRNMGMQSKSETDVINLIEEKIRFPYDNQPDWLKASTAASNARMQMDFSTVDKDSMGNRKKDGNRSMIIGKAPSDTAWESWGLAGWKADEAGKVPGFLSILTLTLPCMLEDDGITLGGFPWVFGTVGDIINDAAGIKTLWYNADAYSFDRHFIPGWAGKCLDEYGNEDIETAVFDLLTEREKKRALGEKEFYEHIQQHPLTPEEAFLASADTYFDNIILSRRDSELDRCVHEEIFERGNFEWLIENVQPVFKKDPNGKVYIVEHPIPGMDYFGGSDPYDSKKKKVGTGSVGATAIYKPPQKLLDGDDLEAMTNDPSVPMAERMKAAKALGNLPVMLYADEGKDPDVFAKQSAMALVYYNGCKSMIESNRGSGMIAWFKRNNHAGLMATTVRMAYKNKSKPTREYGYHRNPASKEYDLSLVDSYHRKFINRIFIPKLISAYLEYDPNVQARKRDEIDAFAFVLLFLEAKMPGAITGKKKEKKIIQINDFGYKKVNGIIKHI